MSDKRKLVSVRVNEMTTIPCYLALEALSSVFGKDLCCSRFCCKEIIVSLLISLNGFE